MGDSFQIASAKFDIQIEGIDFKQCSSVSGLSSHTEKLVIDHGTSSEATYRKGRTFTSDVTIVRAFTDKKLFDWFKECKQGQVKKRSGSVVCKDDDGKPIAKFDFFGAWPIAWAGPTFSTHLPNAVADETIVLAIESIDLS